MKQKSIAFKLIKVNSINVYFIEKKFQKVIFIFARDNSWRLYSKYNMYSTSRIMCTVNVNYSPKITFKIIHIFK